MATSRARSWSSRAAAVGAVVASLTACGGANATSDAGDPGLDAGGDGGGRADAGRDAGTDGGAHDAGTDAGEPDSGSPIVCGAATARFGGELCGPGASSACTILADDRIDPGRETRHTPAVAVDSADVPSILWYVPRGALTTAGMFSTRTAAGWDSARTLFDLSAGGLVFDAADTAVAIASDTFNVDHYERHGVDWTLIERLPTDQAVDARTVHRDEGGCLYALAQASTGLVGGAPTKLLRRDSDWHVTPMGSGVQDSASALALAPSGETHVVWCEIIGGASCRVHWARGAAGDEVAWAGGSYRALGFDVAIAASATSTGDEIPNVLFRAPDAAGGDELRYATRAADATWSVAVLGSGRARGCTEPPTATGDSCVIDGLYFVPIAVVVSGSGDVRLFWVRNSETGTLTGRCGAPGPVSCVWDEATTRDARLFVATPGAPAVEVGAGLDLENASAVVDSTGRIHIAASDIMLGLRYLLVGPAPP